MSDQPVKRIQMVGDPRDLFAEIPDLSQTMYGIIDLLSLWVRRYGFREYDIEAGEIVWFNDDVLQFRLRRKRLQQPISPNKYDRRLPDLSYAFVQRIYRVQYFMIRCHWFYTLCRRIDDNARGWLDYWGVDPKELQVTARWASNGIVAIKFIPPHLDKRNPRRYATHYKDDRY